MNFSEKIKSKRKEFGMSQEQLAEKIGVSRQAITKWETDGGMPDIENILLIASLFGTTVDELLSSEKKLKIGNSFFHESIVEYDIDGKKHYDINIGGAHEITLESNDSEKLRVRLASNLITPIDQLCKIKIDDNKNNIDVDLHRDNELSEAQTKDSLYVFISIPAKFILGIELAAHTNTLKISNIQTENIEFEGKASRIYLDNVTGVTELNSTVDMTVVCANAISGMIGINQLSATSVLHIPKGTEFQLKKKGLSNRVSYTLDGKKSPTPEYPNAKDMIKISGLNTELVVNECTDISREMLY